MTFPTLLTKPNKLLTRNHLLSLHYSLKGPWGLCFCAEAHVGREPRGQVVKVMYDEKTKRILKVSNQSFNIPLSLQVDWANYSDGANLSFFKCGCWSFCEDANRFLLLSDGSITTEKDKNLFVGYRPTDDNSLNNMALVLVEANSSKLKKLYFSDLIQRF